VDSIRAVQQCFSANSRVKETGCIAWKGIAAHGRIGPTDAVAIERPPANAGIIISLAEVGPRPRSVVKKCLKTISRVMDADCVREKRLISGAGISIAGCIRIKRTTADRCVPVTARVRKQRSPAGGGIVDASGVSA
jgi:hypothetical protein